jgi:hypothetical protein
MENVQDVDQGYFRIAWVIGIKRPHESHPFIRGGIMVKRKTLTLREKIYEIADVHMARNVEMFTRSILRLIRTEQKRKCDECNSGMGIGCLKSASREAMKKAKKMIPKDFGFFRGDKLLGDK